MPQPQLTGLSWLTSLYLLCLLFLRSLVFGCFGFAGFLVRVSRNEGLTAAVEHFGADLIRGLAQPGGLLGEFSGDLLEVLCSVFKPEDEVDAVGELVVFEIEFEELGLHFVPQIGRVVFFHLDGQ